MSQILDNQYEGNTNELTRDFFKNVYGYMFAALAVSGVVAYLAGTPDVVFKYFISEARPTGLFYIIMFAPVGLALLIQTRYRKLSMGALLAAFLGYAILIGLSFSVILMAYTSSVIAQAFFVSAGGFAVMAILGYTTKTDLTKMGSLLYMAFAGIFIASIVNVFLGSGMLNFWISVIGVFVFTGLTAFYMQKFKNLSKDVSLTGIERNKLALVGGLMLYILFINLFMSVLRLLGRD
ncbi:MAG: Bax inhibitor-1/YccA family protein [Crocinitomicaceae bacterium]|nr:Bax inhibitor-1/YccA family protein [Crocinitomicaceae bacterium]